MVFCFVLNILHDEAAYLPRLNVIVCNTEFCNNTFYSHKNSMYSAIIYIYIFHASVVECQMLMQTTCNVIHSWLPSYHCLHTAGVK